MNEQTPETLKLTECPSEDLGMLPFLLLGETFKIDPLDVLGKIIENGNLKAGPERDPYQFQIQATKDWIKSVTDKDVSTALARFVMDRLVEKAKEVESFFGIGSSFINVSGPTPPQSQPTAVPEPSEQV